MPVVTFLPSGKTLEVPKGTSLFVAIQRVGLPLAASCSAERVCGKCHVRVLAGADALSVQTEEERTLLRKEGVPLTERISCAVRVMGDCEITTGYWG